MHLALGDPFCMNELCYLLLRYSAQKMLDPLTNKNVFALCEDSTDKDQLGHMRTMTGTDILKLWVEHMAPLKGGVMFGGEKQEGEEEEEEQDDGPARWTVNGDTNLVTVTAVAKQMFNGTTEGDEEKKVTGLYGASLEATLREQKVCNWFYEANHLSCGRIMEIVVSLMFGHKSTLLLPEVEKAEMVEDDTSLSREARTYKTWLTSLLVNIEGSKNIRDLTEDLRDGELLIKLVALITMKPNNPKNEAGETKEGAEPGVQVDWKRVNSGTTSRFKQVENVNYLLELCAELNLNLTNIGPLGKLFFSLFLFSPFSFFF